MPRAIRLILALIGVGVVVLGANIGLGGFQTLGLQFPPPGLVAEDPLGLARHDNNARFLGGVFAGLGLVIGLAALRPALLPAAGLILLTFPLGALARLMQPGYTVWTDMAFAGSLVAEAILAPGLGLWLLLGREPRAWR